MLKIRRLYNRNRRLVWLWIIIVIFVIAIIGIFNLASQETIKANNKKVAQKIEEENQKENPSNVVDYKEAAQAITTSENIDSTIRDEVQKLLENFINYSCNGETQKAYDLLTQDCKNILYPSLEIFDEYYCSDIKDKTYDFKSWAATNSTYVYQVRFFENPLSTGMDTTNNYIQDYITVIKKQGGYQLNINKFIKREILNKEVEKNDIHITVKNVETYLDYEYYEIEINNRRYKQIILDPLIEDNSTYVKNTDGINIEALLYENDEKDLNVKAGETKTLKIKFNNTYNGEKSIQKLGFSNIIIDKEEYQKDNSKGIISVEISLM